LALFRQSNLVQCSQLVKGEKKSGKKREENRKEKKEDKRKKMKKERKKRGKKEENERKREREKWGMGEGRGGEGWREKTEERKGKLTIRKLKNLLQNLPSF
jgi:hypothetical protein